MCSSDCIEAGTQIGSIHMRTKVTMPRGSPIRPGPRPLRGAPGGGRSWRLGSRLDGPRAANAAQSPGRHLAHVPVFVTQGGNQRVDHGFVADFRQRRHGGHPQHGSLLCNWPQMVGKACSSAGELRHWAEIESRTSRAPTLRDDAAISQGGNHGGQGVGVQLFQRVLGNLTHGAPVVAQASASKLAKLGSATSARALTAVKRTCGFGSSRASSR